MKCQLYGRFAWLFIAAFVLSPQIVEAQSRACPQEQITETGSAQESKVIILNFEFPREFPLSEAARAKLEKEIKSQDISTDPEGPESDWWVENYVDWRIREALRSGGYFKAIVHSRPYLVLAKAEELNYIVAVEAEPGPQYRLRYLQFVNYSALSPDELLSLVPLRPGDVFDISKVRDGLEAIGRRYGQLGYVDATAEPKTTIDEKNHMIDLMVKIDEQKQYRLDKFEVVGLDSRTARSLESLVEPGQIFNRASLEALLKEWKNVLPANSSLDRNGRISRNVKDGTIDILLDFRPCPQT